ncbi:dual specificity protein phosphatase family protein [Actibacterium sp. 188UL27-1]|uniref:protein-tyrosine phosphatase family protein n=1 Tax=Actibacterium sp. 188UL27-1 TaxID=2786961 RepID=UPI001958C45A|nr:dual specificity protein phosphatase family protein [Actibacterium sp. 188UL27-1]MBM7068691.1 dual specificity protein phosphatase family protein [Actibacterium sp. 188UL27-1]
MKKNRHAAMQLTDLQTRIPDALNSAPSAYFGPSNFHWLIRGRLGGMSQPGLLRSLENDLIGLKNLNVTHVITLTSEWEAPVAEFHERGISAIRVPIDDMDAPDPRVACDVCAQVDALLQDGGCVTFHCRAGRGRTGTMLAAQLIYYKYRDISAIETVRKTYRHWIESDVQISFLADFAAMLQRS